MKPLRRSPEPRLERPLMRRGHHQLPLIGLDAIANRGHELLQVRQLLSGEQKADRPGLSWRTFDEPMLL